MEIPAVDDKIYFLNALLFFIRKMESGGNNFSRAIRWL